MHTLCQRRANGWQQSSILHLHNLVLANTQRTHKKSFQKGDKRQGTTAEQHMWLRHVSTRQRGQSPVPNPANLWRQEFLHGSPRGHQDLADEQVFRHNLQHTLGYLNDTFGPRTAAPARYVGCPAQDPFPWMTWLNRPLASQMELLLVPCTRSSELLRLYGMRPASSDPYQVA